eukprot:8325024-Pyramimonas_sp.AAC.1
MPTSQHQHARLSFGSSSPGSSKQQPHQSSGDDLTHSPATPPRTPLTQEVDEHGSPVLRKLATSP